VNKDIFYEVFLKYYDELDSEHARLLEQIRKGKNVHVVAMQLYDLDIRISEVNRMYDKLRHWFI